MTGLASSSDTEAVPAFGWSLRISSFLASRPFDLGIELVDHAGERSCTDSMDEHTWARMGRHIIESCHHTASRLCYRRRTVGATADAGIAGAECHTMSERASPSRRVSAQSANVQRRHGLPTPVRAAPRCGIRRRAPPWGLSIPVLVKATTTTSCR